MYNTAYVTREERSYFCKLPHSAHIATWSIKLEATNRGKVFYFRAGYIEKCTTHIIIAECGGNGRHKPRHAIHPYLVSKIGAHRATRLRKRFLVDFVGVLANEATEGLLQLEAIVAALHGLLAEEVASTSAVSETVLCRFLGSTKKVH